MPTWRPSGRSRERILAFGPAGAGKSHAFLTIIAKALGPDDTAWIIDIDNTWDRLLETTGVELGLAARAHMVAERRGSKVVWVEEDGEVDPAGQIVVYHAYGQGYEAEEAAVAEVLAAAERDDWVCIDSMTWIWDDILPWYIRKVYGEELPDFMIEARIEDVKAGKRSAADGATGGQDRTVVDWNFINPRWNKHIATPIVNANCHLWLPAEAKQMRTDGRVDAQVRQLYEQVGWVPASQKRLGHQVQTVLFLSQGKNGEHRFTIVKDRGRELVKDQPWDDMFAGYLRKIAGWKPERPNKGAADG